MIKHDCTFFFFDKKDGNCFTMTYAVCPKQLERLFSESVRKAVA
jgi:hypothetical protein